MDMLILEGPICSTLYKKLQNNISYKSLICTSLWEYCDTLPIKCLSDRNMNYKKRSFEKGFFFLRVWEMYIFFFYKIFVILMFD